MDDGQGLPVTVMPKAISKWAARAVTAAGSIALLALTSGFWYWLGLFGLAVVVLSSLGVSKVPRRKLESPSPGEGLDVLLIDVGQRDLDILKVYGQFSDLGFDEMDALIDEGDLPAPMNVSLTLRDAEELVALISKHGGNAEILRK